MQESLSIGQAFLFFVCVCVVLAENYGDSFARVTGESSAAPSKGSLVCHLGRYWG